MGLVHPIHLGSFSLVFGSSNLLISTNGIQGEIAKVLDFMGF